MTGKEAKKILEEIEKIQVNLIEGNDRSAFYRIGRLTERLLQIIAIDECSFNPTIKKDEIEKIEQVNVPQEIEEELDKWVKRVKSDD